MSTKREIWAERVKAWRASGESSPQFCEGKGFSPGGLRYWASRLQKEARAGKSRGHSKSTARKKRTRSQKKPTSNAVVQMARVVRTSPGAPPSTMRGSSIVFDFAGVHVEVGPDFDRAAMRDLLALFGEHGDVVAMRGTR